MMRLVFHHSMKTGGSYVLKVLQQAGFSHKRVPWSDNRSGREIVDTLESPSLFSSHHAYRPECFAPQQGEFYFTWVRNPADMAYSIYAYLRKHPERTHNPQPAHLFERIRQHDTLEGYIDAVLASEAPFFPETAFTGLDFSKFDFIGSAERMAESLAALAERTDSLIPLDTEPVNRSGATYTYRRAELAERLAPERKAVEPWL